MKRFDSTESVCKGVELDGMAEHRQETTGMEKSVLVEIPECKRCGILRGRVLVKITEKNIRKIPFIRKLSGKGKFSENLLISSESSEKQVCEASVERKQDYRGLNPRIVFQPQQQHHRNRTRVGISFHWQEL